MNKFHDLACLMKNESWHLILTKKSKFDFLVYSQNWSIDWEIQLSILCIWDLLDLLSMSGQFHGVLESICELDLQFARSNSQKLPLCSQNPKNDHFALLVIWSNFLWNCHPNLIKWSMWVHNVDVGQFSWDLTVNWPQLTFSPIQLISRSTVQLIEQKLWSKTWNLTWAILRVQNDTWKSYWALWLKTTS